MSQFAFKKLHSTLTCLLNVIDPWFKNSDEGKINLSIFLDLKKAFDTVDHKILLSKLREYGAEGSSNSWFTSYLTNREQSIISTDPLPAKAALSVVFCRAGVWDRYSLY